MIVQNAKGEEETLYGKVAGQTLNQTRSTQIKKTLHCRGKEWMDGAVGRGVLRRWGQVSGW